MESRQHRNLESYTLIWCQDNVEQTKEIQLQLRRSINYLKTFQTVHECHDYINNNITKTLFGENEKVVLIVSMEFVTELMLHVHELKQILVVYIYAPLDKDEKEILEHKFNKVSEMFHNKS